MCDECDIRDARIGELEQKTEELEDALGDAEKKLKARMDIRQHHSSLGDMTVTVAPDRTRLSRRVVATIDVSEQAMMEARSGPYVASHIAEELSRGLRREIEKLLESLYNTSSGRVSRGPDPTRFIPHIWEDHLMQKIYGYHAVVPGELMASDALAAVADVCLGVRLPTKEDKL